jgi:SIR2-like protein
VVYLTDGPNSIVFLVGAGLLNDAKLPMSVELVEKLKTDLSDVASDTGLTDKEKTDAQCQLAALHFLNGAIRFQEGVLNHDPDKPINIEQIAVAAIELQARLQNPLAPYTSGWHGRVVELEDQCPEVLKGFIEFIFARLRHWLTFASRDDIAYLARFNDFCINGRGVDIFSLNYDLCIETALRDVADKAFLNGFTPDGWRPSTFIDDGSQIRLFKLHGSLDWVDDEEGYGLCSLEFPRHKDAEDIEGSRPLLIFGTSHKLSAREPFLSLAYQFSQEVLRTNVLVIIGYSLGDAYINEIIKQGLRTNTRLKIVFVSPNAEDRIREDSLLSRNPRIVPLNKNAKVALEDGSLLTRVRELVKESDAEEPF